MTLADPQHRVALLPYYFRAFLYLFFASVKAGAVIGLIVGLSKGTLRPALSMAVFGPPLTLPAIAVGAIVVVHLVARGLGRRHHLFLAGLFVGTLYAFLFTFRLSDIVGPVPAWWFAAGGGLSGIFAHRELSTLADRLRRRSSDTSAGHAVLLALCFLAALSVSPQPSSAREINTYYCNEHYTDISAIYYAVDIDISEDRIGVSRASIESWKQRDLDNYVHEHIDDGTRIPIHKASDSIENTLQRDPFALYLTIRYFYAAKGAFEPPLPFDAVVVRVDTSRMHTTDTSETRTELRTFHMPPYEFILIEGYDPKYSLGNPYFFGGSQSLHRIACELLPYVAKKWCLDPASFTSKAAPITRHCVPRPKKGQKEPGEYDLRGGGD